jgi:uncharacterized membrane protein YeaQ/YmgE (transglycosylase-associated protein family)
MLGTLLSIAFSAFLIGALARFALPGPDPMPFWLTIALGLGGSLIGGAVAAALLGPNHTFDNSNHAFVTVLLEIGAAVVLLAAYRRFVQRRPLFGPGAYTFPSRGVGVQRMRDRLRGLGVDPDTLTLRHQRESSKLSHGEQIDELEKLRERHDKGELSDEEFERAREELRRY